MSDDRSKRRLRRHNKIAKDLRTPKYRQRIVEKRPKYEPSVEELNDYEPFEDDLPYACPVCGWIYPVGKFTGEGCGKPDCPSDKD